MPVKTELHEVSWEPMEQGIGKARQRLLRAAAALRAAGVCYAVVEGNAVAAWVSRMDESAVRNTRDVDILVRRADFEKIRAALESVGFVYRQASALGRSGRIDLFLDNAEAKARDAIHIVWAGEKVTKDSLEPAPDPAGSEESGGFALVSLESLVRMKLSAFRDKDRMHLRDLLEVGLIDPEWIPRYRPPSRSVSARFSTILSVSIAPP